MEFLLFAAGGVSGFIVGALLAARVILARTGMARVTANAAAGFARFGLDTLPERTAADLLAGRIRLRLGGVEYVLPVLPMKASAAWLESLDGRFTGLAENLEKAGNDVPRILELVAADEDGLLELLRTYDVHGILPPRDWITEYATRPEILAATVEVWRASHPLAVTLVEATAAGTTDGTSSGQPSKQPSPSGGDLSTSNA